MLFIPRGCLYDKGLKLGLILLSITIVHASTLPHKPYLSTDLAQTMVIAAQKKAEDLCSKFGIATI